MPTLQNLTTSLSLAALLCTGAALAEVTSPHHHGDDSDANSAVPAHQHHPRDQDMPTPRGQPVTLEVTGGKASTGYLATPRRPVKGAVLVLHEYWGLNNWIRHEADLLADDGYLALAVDLYDGTVATTPDQAMKLMGALDQARATQIETAGVAYLKQHAPKKKIATVGWCMGGGQSLNASLTNAADVNATVIYYGMPVTEVAQLKKLRGPVLGLFAKKDGWITPDKVTAFDKALTEAGVKHSFQSYDADHAFANPTGGKFNPPAAHDADLRTKEFLAKSLL